jgi:hypothetical protein
MNRMAQSVCMVLIAASLPLFLAAAPAAGAAGGVGRGAAGAARGGAGANRAANGAVGTPGGMALNRAFYATEMETLAQQVTLTEAQRAKLLIKIDTMNREIDTFLQNAPAQIAAARGRGAAGARGAGAGRGGRAGRGANAAIPAARGGPNPMVLQLQDELQLLINQHQVLINQELTPEQRITWETYLLHRTLDPRILPLSPTDDQNDKIKTLIDKTANALAELTDGKTMGAIQGQLYRKLVADVLTDAQVGRLFQGALQVQGAGRAQTPAAAPALP